MKLEELLKTKNIYLSVHTAHNTNESIADRKEIIKSLIKDMDAYNLFFVDLMKKIKPNTLYQMFGVWTKTKRNFIISLPRLFCSFSEFKRKNLIADYDAIILNTEWENIEKILIDNHCEIIFINNKKDKESIYFKMKRLEDE